MMKANKFIIEEISKIVEEFVKENELDIREYNDKIIRELHENDFFQIDSEKLEFGGDKFFRLAEMQESAHTEGDSDYLKSQFEEIKRIIDEKDSYYKYEFVFIVRNMSSKILLEKKATSVLKRKLVRKGMSVRGIEIKAAFIPEQKYNTSVVSISSNIQSLEYTLKNECEETARIYTANLFDLVKLYNIKGDSLFSDNVRFQIADKLDVDKKIEGTLRETPDKFWLFNNGITVLADRTCIDTRKQHKLCIKLSPSSKVSVINGAQTISAASHFFYAEENETVVNKAKEEALVVLRVVLCDKGAKKKELYNEISISLNRQKAINEANMRYTDQLVEDINQLYSENKKTPYFYITRDGEKGSKDSVDVINFAKISALYLLQQPGMARSSKSTVIKVDDYWNKLRLSEYDDKSLEEIFLTKYTPFLYVRDLFELFSKRMKYYEKDKDAYLSSWCSYGTEFLVAYIVWLLNGKKDTDFSLFKMQGVKEIDEQLIDEIIHEYARCVQNFYGEEIIVSNVTKLDSEYKKVREHLEIECIKLNDLIQKMQ